MLLNLTFDLFLMIWVVNTSAEKCKGGEHWWVRGCSTVWWECLEESCRSSTRKHCYWSLWQSFATLSIGKRLTVITTLFLSGNVNTMQSANSKIYEKLLVQLNWLNSVPELLEISWYLCSIPMEKKLLRSLRQQHSTMYRCHMCANNFWFFYFFRVYLLVNVGQV